MIKLGSVRWRRAIWLGLGGLALALVVAACGSGDDGSGGASSGGETRTVQVDYRSDQMATSLFSYYPRQVAVRPGDTVEFKQAWTGAPHSVTMGTLVDEKIGPIISLLQGIEKSGDIPPGEPEEFGAFFEALPGTFGEGEGFAQNAAQPCYVDQLGPDGKYPGDEKTPCPDRVQPPAFNGRQAIYSSGLIPYEGVKGNTFMVKLADDIDPGTYTFYCNLHGPLQYGQLKVLEKGTAIPSKGEVAKQARTEAEKVTGRYLRNFRAAKEGKEVVGGEELQIKIDAGKTNMIGVPTPFFEDHTFLNGFVNEFVPNKLETKVGQKTTWTFTGGHTISFNVPKYFPIFTVEKDGKVVSNPQASEAIGWPERPGGGSDSHDGPPPEPVEVDGGTWDGQGFRSTGLGYNNLDKFSVTFTKPGTYSFACLVHPQMVGKLVVKA